MTRRTAAVVAAAVMVIGGVPAAASAEVARTVAHRTAQAEVAAAFSLHSELFG